MVVSELEVIIKGSNTGLKQTLDESQALTAKAAQKMADDTEKAAKKSATEAAKAAQKAAQDIRAAYEAIGPALTSAGRTLSIAFTAPSKRRQLGEADRRSIRRTEEVGTFAG